MTTATAPSRAGEPAHSRARTRADPHTRNPYWLIFASLFAVVAGLASSLLLDRGEFLTGWFALLSSIVLWRWPISIWNGDRQGRMSRHWRWGGLAAVSGMGIFYRFHQLDPPGLWGDDAINGLLAYDVLDGKIDSPFTLVAHAHSHFHALTNYLILGAFKLFGPGITSIRLPGVIVSALCVPVLYGIAAPLFGARAALIASAFFATAPLQLAHAKSLPQIVIGQLGLMLGLCLLVRGVEAMKRNLVIASAVPFALCIYTYHSAKLAPLVAVPYIVATLRGQDRRGQVLKSSLGVAGGVFLVCLIPAIAGYVSFPHGLSRRIGGTSIWPLVREQGLAPLWDSVWRTLLIFHFEQGPVYHWFGLGFDPALTAIVAFLAVHGLVTSLLRWREPRHLLLLTWAFVGLVPGFLSTEPPRVYRVLLATPPFFVWAALPLANLLALTTASRLVQRSIHGIAILLIAAVPLLDFNAYFYRVYTHPLFRHFQGERMVEMARALRELGPGWNGRLLSDNFGAGYETLRFLQRTWNLDIEDGVNLGETLISDKGENGAVFLMSGSVFPIIPVLEEWYPGQTVETIRLPEQRAWWFDDWWPLVRPGEASAPIAAVLAVPKSAMHASRGLNARFPVDESGRTVRAVQRLPRLDAARVKGMSAGVARWDGLLGVLQRGRYELRLLADGPVRLWLDQIEIENNRQTDAGTLLFPGLHLLSIEARVPETRTLRFEWKPPGEAWSEVPAERLFRRAEHGLLVTYEVQGVSARRFEPYPFYAFFPPTFSTHSLSIWRGTLQVPPGGRKALRVTTNGRSRLLIDGKDAADAELATGTHRFTLELRGVPETARLLVEWQKSDGTIEPVPPEAFAPPPMPGRSDP